MKDFDISDIFKNISGKQFEYEKLYDELAAQHLKYLSEIPSQFRTKDILEFGIEHGWIVAEKNKYEVVVPEIKTHVLKSWPRFFDAVLSGQKKHELRKNDRNFKVGDLLQLKEFDPETDTFTGREQIVEITYITSAENPCALSDNGLTDGFCVLSIDKGEI